MQQTLGPVMLDLLGTELNQEEREMLRHPLVGGVILFARNYENPQQVKALCQQIKQARNPELLIAVDQEGGRVQRFRNGFTPLPAVEEFSKLYQQNPAKALELTQQAGCLMAMEVCRVGVDISFAPVLDLNYGVSTVIGNRSFGREPAQVITLAKAYIKGMNDAGMAATGKHFPGHGGVSADSHVAIPEDPRDFEQLEQADMQPFAMLANSLAGIMPAHVIYPQVDQKPAGFSAIWLQQILRQRLKFQGIIFSDDLTMEGASVVGNYLDRAEAAMTAGCDMILICNNQPAAMQVLEQFQHTVDRTLTTRLQRLKAKPKTFTETHYQSIHTMITTFVGG